MSADNGYMIQRTEDGRFALQMFFMSADCDPNPKSAKDSELFDTLGAAMHAFVDILASGVVCEYGLYVNVSPELISEQGV